MNAFLLWVRGERKRVSSDGGRVSQTSLSKLLGETWRHLSVDEKQPFLYTAKSFKKHHHIDHPNYKLQSKKRWTTATKTIVKKHHASMKGHRFFRQSAEIAVEIYIHLYGHPLSDEDNDKNDNLSNMSAGEAKKLRSKLRKQQMREQQEKQKQIEAERRKKESQRSRNKVDGEEEKIKEEEIVAEKLERYEKPLEEAMRFLQPLEDFSSNFLQTHYLGFEVYYRRKKFVLMLRCLKRMKKLDANNAKFHSCLMKFLQLLENEPITDERLRTLIDDELKTFGVKQGGSIKKIEELNTEFIKNHSNSLAHRAEAAKVMLLINPSNNLKAIEFLTTLDSSFIHQNLKLGDYGSVESSMLEKYRTECNKLWPQANIFQLNPASTFDQSQSSPLPSYSSVSTPPPPYASCDSQTNGGDVDQN